jgi:hypothetical protein
MTAIQGVFVDECTLENILGRASPFDIPNIILEPEININSTVFEVAKRAIVESTVTPILPNDLSAADASGAPDNDSSFHPTRVMADKATRI